MQQMNLFNTSSEISGFRLDYMELYNWGTFHNQVYRLAPQGNNSLLTGANASGKSTLIDALLTLLVPLKRKRFYNQSSGVEKKGDRTEESYFFGNYGNQQQEGGGVKTLRLRDKNSYSVLLACFKSVESRVLTLFQVRYFSGEELKTLYGIAKDRLEIERDFANFNLNGTWRRHLEKVYNANRVKKTIDFCSGPVEYGERICDLFGMRSDKALQLFNQIVGVKVLDDLDDFIRQNMLEEEPAEERYIELKVTFQNLMEAKLSIEKTEEQIKQLEPIVRYADELEQTAERLESLTQEKDVAAYWFAQRMVNLCDEQIEKYELDRKLLNEELEKLKTQTTEKEKEKVDLQLAIRNDETGRRINELETKIRSLEAKRASRRVKAESYKQLAQQVELVADPTAEEFEANKVQAKALKEQLQTEIDDSLTVELHRKEEERRQIGEQINEYVDTIKYLQQHQHNITGRVAEIRDEILEYTGATSDEIPFIGELIQVRDEEREWEASIERILHNFALRLIVPDAYYEEVNEFVNSRNLNGRIVYQRYRDFTSLRNLEGWDMEENSLLNKIQFKSDNRYKEWLEDAIYREFNYACVDSLTEFAFYEEKAVTREGLIKSVKGKHEKDDRAKVKDKAHYVLGWDNKEKIRTLQAAVRDCQENEKAVAAQMKAIKDKREKLKQMLNTLSELDFAFEQFDVIDWRRYAQELQEKTEAKQKLEATNDRVKALQEQLNQVEALLKELTAQVDILNKKVFKTEMTEEELNAKRNLNQSFLQTIGEVDTADFVQAYPQLLEIVLDNLEAAARDFQEKNNDAITGLKKKKESVQSKVAILINKFKNPSAEITERFRDWRSDVNSLPESDHLELISEYQSFYRRLLDEDLISFQERFNTYLRETITHNVNAFRIFFQHWEENIRKTIEQLNVPLKAIDFDNHPHTYIQLVATRKLDVETNEFKTLLEKAIPNHHQMESTIDGRKLHFENHIEPFIRRLEDEKWRNKVMDVRSWFTYKAEEFYKENEQKRKTYETMGQLSGGEKAQLTYTILGSAIACQFGLTRSGRDSSFRFIAIDEAFKAQDETKARYLISLCQQLHLQLLVVTPSDNIHIVENDISFVHYVERQGDRSVLYNMPIRQFKDEREKYSETDEKKQ